MEIGTRVVAMSHIEDKDKKVYLFGVGTYAGEQIPMEACGQIGTLFRIAKEVSPAIKLDSGPTIYGCECWWLEEPLAVQMISEYAGKSYQIINVSIEEERKLWREREGEKAERECREIYASIKGVVERERQKFKKDMADAEKSK